MTVEGNDRGHQAILGGQATHLGDDLPVPQVHPVIGTDRQGGPRAWRPGRRQITADLHPSKAIDPEPRAWLADKHHGGLDPPLEVLVDGNQCAIGSVDRPGPLTRGGQAIAVKYFSVAHVDRGRFIDDHPWEVT